MSITGHAKFFEPSQCLEKDGATIVATSGDAASIYAIDRNPDTRWRSVGSNDATVETVVVTFPSAKTIDRLFFLDINWKLFSVQYDVVGVWTNFTSVIGLDGSLGGGISETVFADDTAYYEFAQVTTSAIRIQVTSTQTANEQKYVAQIIATRELGTLLGWPKIKNVELDRNSRIKKTLSGKMVVQKSLETAGFEMNFDDYPSKAAYSPDFDLLLNLHDRETPFIAWLCGGKRGTFFNYILRGWRLRDAYTVQITKPLKLGYSDNVYKNQINGVMVVEEHV